MEQTTITMTTIFNRLNELKEEVDRLNENLRKTQ